MELEQLIADVNSVQPKNGFTDRLKTIRDAVKVQDGAINLETVNFENFESHTNHSDHDNNRPKPKSNGNLLKLKTITLKMISEINSHYDHSDHNDFTDVKP